MKKKTKKKVVVTEEDLRFIRKLERKHQAEIEEEEAAHKQRLENHRFFNWMKRGAIWVTLFGMLPVVWKYTLTENQMMFYYIFAVPTFSLMAWFLYASKWWQESDDE